MLTNIENLKLISILRGISAEQCSFRDRFSHALIFKISGESSYHFSEQSILLSAGDLLFIPKGASYQVKRHSETSEYLLINFDADLSDAVAQLYPLHSYPNLNRLVNHTDQLWLFGGDSERYQCYSIIYDLFSFLSKKEAKPYTYQQKFQKIKPAVLYLQANIFQCDLCVEALHHLCNLSDTYFRKIFKANFGTTPQEYITNKRLSQASNIIKSGDYATIGKVSYMVGYRDALYFSRLFSKKYGVSPSEYQKLFQK